MVKLCCIPICPNSRVDRGVDCYPFPSADAELRDKWIDFVGAANAQKFRWKTKYICAAHFHQLDLIQADGGGTQLAQGALPVLYSPDDDEDDWALEWDTMMVSEEVSESTSQLERPAEEPWPLREVGKMRLYFCRICLKKAKGLVPLNSKLHNESLLDIIYTITGLTIENEENLPTKLCGRCVEKLDLAYSLRVEFLHQEEILRNLIKNRQLEAHYRSYDNHRNDSRTRDEAYLKNLMGNFQRDVTVEEPVIDLDPVESIKIEPIVVGAEDDEFLEEMVEEHLQDEEEFKNDSPDESAMKIESDLEEEEPSPTKYVYSWKELCKPKRTHQPKEYKITEDLPEPELVPNTCYVCNTVHKDADALEFHMEIHVSLVPYTCDQCSTNEVPQVQKSLISLNKHLQTHLFPYLCDFCPLRYLSRRAYIAHMRSTHEEADNDGYTCDDCGQHFTRKPTFTAHLYKHRAIREGE